MIIDWPYVDPVRRRTAAAAEKSDRSFRLPLTEGQLERLHKAAEARGLKATPMAKNLLLRFADFVLGVETSPRPVGVSTEETDAYLAQALGEPRK